LNLEGIFMLKKLFAIILGLALTLNVQASSETLTVQDVMSVLNSVAVEQGDPSFTEDLVSFLKDPKQKLKANKRAVALGLAAGVVIPTSVLLVLAYHGLLGEVMLKQTPDYLLSAKSKTKKTQLKSELK
jgi:hypothetical protein